MILYKDRRGTRTRIAKYSRTRVRFVPEIQGLAPCTALISFQKAQEAEKRGLAPPRVGPANGRRAS